MVHHKIWSETSSRAHVMIFSFKGEGALLDRLGGAYSCDEELQEKWNALFCRMKASGSSYGHTGFLQYLTQWPNEAQEVVNLCENQLLALESHGLPLGFNQSRSALNYKQIVQTMKHNLDKNLTVEELGMQCGLSASSMKKLFRQFNSMGIHEYYLHLKMKEAVRLLEEGRTVTETAERLGFSDQSYFSTAFKREMNEMPTRFRRNRT